MEKDYEQDLPTFELMPWSIEEIRNAIPSHLFICDTRKGLAYSARDVILAVLAWTIATYIDPIFRREGVRDCLTPLVADTTRWLAWCLYWWFQGLIFTGLWVIGHECGHGALSSYRRVCDSVGFVLHSFLLTPYFSWKIVHHRHHRNHASMERDEVYVPKTRSELGIPKVPRHEIDWDEYLGDTPVYTLYTLILQQLLAFPAYLMYNVSGQKHYPRGTNHFSPSSVLFTPGQAPLVIASNIGLLTMGYILWLALQRWGAMEVLKFYGIPWLLVTHWFVMITYLHHTDRVLPHYRGSAWNFQRGAAATVDRDFLGWQGRFFLHDVAHFHVIHHFFPKMPFYHTPEGTRYLKKFIGDYYCYSAKPVFEALWESYNDCQFVEDEGEVLFYKDRKGRAIMQPIAQALD